jgi:hypothetical protein
VLGDVLNLIVRATGWKWKVIGDVNHVTFVVQTNKPV